MRCLSRSCSCPVFGGSPVESCSAIPHIQLPRPWAEALQEGCWQFRGKAAHQLFEEGSLLVLLWVALVLVQSVLQLQGQRVVVGPHHFQNLPGTAKHSTAIRIHGLLSTGGARLRQITALAPVFTTKMASTANIWLMTNNTEVGTKVFLMPRNSPEIYRISPFMRMVDGICIHDSSSFLSSELDILINQAANYHMYTQVQHRSTIQTQVCPTPRSFQSKFCHHTSLLVCESPFTAC